MTERAALRRRRAGAVGGMLYALDVLIMFLRVAIITTAWIALFLGTFFGYLTAPFVVLVAFVIVYAVVDRFRIRARKEAEARRAAQGDPTPEPVYEAGRAR